MANIVQIIEIKAVDTAFQAAMARSLASLEKLMEAAQAANTKVTQAGGTGGAALGKIGAAAEKATPAIREMVTQLASGKGALEVIAQQAGPLLSAFGPAGALAGAVVSLGALGLEMLLASQKAKEAALKVTDFDGRMAALQPILDTSTTSVEQLNEAYAKLTDTQKKLQNVRLAGAIEAGKADLKALIKEINDKIEAAGKSTVLAEGYSNAPKGLDHFNLPVPAEALALQPNIDFPWKISITDVVGADDKVRAALRKAVDSKQLGAEVGQWLDISDKIKTGNIEEAISLMATGEKTAQGLGRAISEIQPKYTEKTEKIKLLAAQLANNEGTATPEQLELLNRTDAVAKPTADPPASPPKATVSAPPIAPVVDNSKAEAAKLILADLEGAFERYQRKVAEINALELDPGKWLSPEDAARARGRAAINYANEVMAEAEKILGPAMAEIEKKAEERKSAAAQVKESFRGPVEIYNQRIAQLNDLRATDPNDKDGLSEDIYNKAAESAKAEMEKAMQALDPFKAGMASLQQTLIGGFSGIGDSIASSLLKGQDAFKSLGNIATNVLNQVMGSMIQMAVVNPILNSVFGLTGSAMLPMLMPLSSGGWTGNAPRNAATGVVHGQEMVIKAPFAGQFRGALEQLNSGGGLPTATMPVPVPVAPLYAVPQAGGGGPLTVNVQNAPAGTSAQVRQRNGAGGREIDVYLESKVRQALPGALSDGSIDTAMRGNYGMSRLPTRRG